ncbi:hypothetical protein [Frankia sp. QA3]|uniref:hypothetical protein n=1 Tax=Frankia sp. QA3 TaxID=710111 RepID=UPI0018DED7C9|nr:hypothetical protein [Frankia sp. QA3]
MVDEAVRYYRSCMTHPTPVIESNSVVVPAEAEAVLRGQGLRPQRWSVPRVSRRSVSA